MAIDLLQYFRPNFLDIGEKPTIMSNNTLPGGNPNITLFILYHVSGDASGCVGDNYI